MNLYSHQNEWFSSKNPVLFAKKEISIETLPKSDKRYATAFLSTLESSYQYWYKKTSGQKNVAMMMAKPDACTVAPYAADVAGGLYGMIAGPAWAIVEGGIFSAWTAISCS